jgi:hypothetical protein
MPTRRARLVVAAIPITTLAAFVTEIAIATTFGNFHDCAVFRLIDQQRVAVHCNGRHDRWNPAEQRNNTNAGARNLFMALPHLFLTRAYLWS